MDDHIDAGDACGAAAQAFIAKWQGISASELSTSQSFLLDLCAQFETAPEHDRRNA